MERNDAEKVKRSEIVIISCYFPALSDSPLFMRVLAQTKIIRCFCRCYFPYYFRD